MKKFLILSILSLIVSAPGAFAEKAIMVAHYGSSEAGTRAKTIQAITDDIAAAFPGIEVRQAYISPIVSKRMKAAGLDAPSPIECLRRLAAEGYDSVYVQSTTIIDGEEMRAVADACNEMKPVFKHLAVGRPLCFSPADCLKVVEILAAAPCAADEAVVWVGHGNNLSSTATYAQLDYMLATSGNDNVHVSTIEGYPTAESLIAELRRTPEVKRLRLMPFLLVCGNHTREDIAGEFADRLQQAGYATEVIYQGFAENPAVRRIYVDRVADLLAAP